MIPASESLKDVIARGTDQLRPAIKSGKTVLVVGHSTNLRALSAWIEPKLDPKALQKLEIKNTKPILYEFDKDMNVIGRKVLEPTTENKE